MNADLGDANKKWDTKLQHVPTTNRKYVTSRTAVLNSTKI